MNTQLQIREGVRRAYSAAARCPEDKHPFPVGRRFALEVGYPEDVLDSLPEAAVDSFAGVSNVSIFAELPEGARVLDLGCGAGLDTILAARRVGPDGKVCGVDFSEEMIGRARRARTAAGITNVELVMAEAQSLPRDPAEFDVALVNGIFNLSPDREGVFRELYRVLRPGGRAYVSELVLIDPPTVPACCSPENWFS